MNQPLRHANEAPRHTDAEETTVTSLSPSLGLMNGALGSAFELKFAISKNQADALEQRLCRQLTLDPHAESKLENSYRITTLYSDTANFDVYHRAGFHRTRKFRLRRYGEEQQVYLERKTKRQTQVKKKRSISLLSELEQLRNPNSPEDWKGKWFHTQVQSRSLRPVCLVNYSRRAYFGFSDNGQVRLTFDQNIASVGIDQWTMSVDGPQVSIADGLVICEFKFQGSLPTIFKSVMQELKLVPAGFSKYRQCVQALGIVVSGRDRHV